jgi:hypothetical protein
MEINQLTDITDVTDRLNKATQGLTGKPYADTLKAEMAKVEKECATGDQVRCEVVTLYQGGKYNLYKYRRFQDVRLVFAPEHAIAFFGGDPDNFEFPRYDLDVTFLRIYGQDGKPVATENYFPWSRNGAQEGELTFVSGNPGKTSRGLTVAELEFTRDVVMPKQLMTLAEVRGMINEFQKRGHEQERISNNVKFGVENAFKAIKGREEALLDKKFFASKVAAEQELRKKVEASPELKKKYGAAWDEIAKALEQLKSVRTELTYMEHGQGLSGDLFEIARHLVRAAEELPKENSQRLREYTDAKLPAFKRQLLSPAPIYPELEIARMEFGLTKLREELGPDHPFVKKVLGKESPRTLATRLVNGTKLRDPSAREQLLNGGKKAIDASQDPMVQLARLVDADSRAVRKNFEENIDSVIKKNSELVAKARFDVYGTNVYPDATFSPRVSYGAVQGYMEDGRKVAPFTVMSGAFDRHTGEDPFALPKTWLDAKGKLKLTTPMNLVTTNDIIGGNSGSPLINKNAEIVGLVFDGNIQSLGGDFGFDESVNRTVSVHSDAIIEALQKVYNANRVLEELRPTKPAAVKSKPAG